MEVENLQSYLNWLIYLQRCKERNTQIILCSPVTHNKKIPYYHTIVIRSYYALFLPLIHI